MTSACRQKEKKTFKTHALEDWHPLALAPWLEMLYIKQSMQLHLSEAICNVDFKQHRSVSICQNQAVWITCQSNMYIVSLQPNQQRSSGDKGCNIQQERQKKTRASVDLRLCHVSSSGTYLIDGKWHWLSSVSKWIRSLTGWAQERGRPPHCFSGDGAHGKQPW